MLTLGLILARAREQTCVSSFFSGLIQFSPELCQFGLHGFIFMQGFFFGFSLNLLLLQGFFFSLSLRLFSHTITHNSSLNAQLPEVLEAFNEGSDTPVAAPEGFNSRFPVTLAYHLLYGRFLLR